MLFFFNFQWLRADVWAKLRCKNKAYEGNFEASDIKKKNLLETKGYTKKFNRGKNILDCFVPP